MYPKPRRVVNATAVEAVKARDVYCLVCGRPPMKEPHHIVPRSLMGPDAPENLVMLCHEHHMAAHSGRLSRECLQDMLRKKYGYAIP